MSWGSSFKSAWNKASDAVKQKVAQVATTVKQTVNKAVNTAKEAAKQAQEKAKFISQQTAKVAQTVKKEVKQSLAVAKQKATTVVNNAKNQINKAIQTAKPLVKKAFEQAKQKLKETKNAAQQKIASARKKAKDAFNKIKKIFDPKKLAKAVIESCPVVKPLSKAKKAIKSDASLKSKGASLLSSGITLWKDIGKVKKAGKFIKAATTAGSMAAKYGPDSKSVALFKNFTRAGTKVKLGGIATSIAIKGLTGGLDTFAANVDRSDISKSNLAGRVVYGAAKGMTKSAVSAGMGAVAGAAIGAILGSVIPGPGTAAGAVAGAKLGATLLSPIFDKPSEWVTDKIFTKAGEDKAGAVGDQASSAIKGTWTGAMNLIRPPNGGAW